jgi:hypothetical protein
LLKIIPRLIASTAFFHTTNALVGSLGKVGDGLR